MRASLTQTQKIQSGLLKTQGSTFEALNPRCSRLADSFSNQSRGLTELPAGGPQIAGPGHLQVDGGPQIAGPVHLPVGGGPQIAGPHRLLVQDTPAHCWSTQIAGPGHLPVGRGPQILAGPGHLPVGGGPQIAGLAGLEHPR
jgi:hypothetical protein